MTEEFPVVVSAEWLATHLDEVHVVDVRDAWEFETLGHIPGAVNTPFETFRDADGGDVGMLPGTTTFAAIAGEAGIEPDDRIVAYDDEHGVFASRFLVTALLYGHEHWHLLDGDFTAWSHKYETSTDPPTIEKTDYPALVPDDRPLVDADDVRKAIGDGAVLLDTRTEAEFRAGHIEGAVNFDWRDLVDADTRGLKSPEELESILASHGLSRDRRVVLYCNTARRISHTYVVLTHLEYQDVDFYEGSLTDWRDRGLALVSDE